MTLLNLVARFVLELAGVGAIAYAGFQLAGPHPWRVLVAIGGALALVVVWALVVAPNADNPIAPPARVLIGSGLLLLAAGGLALADRPVLASVLAVAVVVNTGLLFVLGDRLPAMLAAAGSRGA
jgi:hypothetical protein